MRECFRSFTPHEAIRQHVEGVQGWKWRAIATTLYQWRDRSDDYFLERQILAAVLGFEHLDERILAAYTLRRNPQGLLSEITLNTRPPECSLWETLRHDYAPRWQQSLNEHPVDQNDHNLAGRAFTEFLRACGGGREPCVRW